MYISLFYIYCLTLCSTKYIFRLSTFLHVRDVNTKYPTLSTDCGEEIIHYTKLPL